MFRHAVFRENQDVSPLLWMDINLCVSEEVLVYLFYALSRSTEVERIVAFEPIKIDTVNTDKNTRNMLKCTPTQDGERMKIVCVMIVREYSYIQ